MSRYLILMVAWGLVWVQAAQVAAQPGPYFATGIKIGEVTDTTAMIWVRLTKQARPVPATAPMFRVVPQPVTESTEPRQFAVEFPDDTSLESVRYAAAGNDGQVKIRYRPRGTGAWQASAWKSVDAARDHTLQHQLTHLEPARDYEIQVRARRQRGDRESAVLLGGFQTAAGSNSPSEVRFVVSTGQMFDDRDSEDGFEIYRTMLRRQPSFFVHTGDIVYYDKLGKSPELARYHWQRTYSLPSNLEFHRQVASYFIKDDHDTLVNDCWPTMRAPQMGKLTFEAGQKIFREQVPLGESTYRTVRRGRHLQLWLVEGRDFRSANHLPDGPEKTIWGQRQKDWFKSSVRRSDATFKILISATPLVGPDRKNKADNHANSAFAHEGNELREFIATQPNLFVVCGDRHWQYHSVDPATGVHEYSCGPASDKHAGGWRQDDYRQDYHRFLKVAGGFLEVDVTPAENPMIHFRFFGTSGQLRYETKHRAHD